MSDPKPAGKKIEDIEESIVSSASPFEEDSDEQTEDDPGDVADRDGAAALDGDDAEFTA